MPKTRKASSPAVRKSRAVKIHPTREEIALRAYEIFLERGGAPGNELEDWTRAERELHAISIKTHRSAKPRSIAA
jgi:Protein of unknown function (DUF2934)